MKLKEKVDFIINKLEEIYPTLDIPLDHKDEYTLLIAVLMSAQATDKKVNEITPILFSRADNPYDMAKMTIDEIRNIIKPVANIGNCCNYFSACLENMRQRFNTLKYFFF